MNSRFLSRLLLATVVLLTFDTLSWSKDNPDRTQFNHAIRVEDGEKVSDVTCINCSIYVRGQVAGDATAIHGNVVLYQGASVAGDVTTILGDARLESGSTVGGDLTSVGGAVRRDLGATISGNVTSMESKAIMLVAVVGPLLVLGLIIALIVWLIQRHRRPAAVPV